MTDLRLGVVGLGARSYLAGHAHHPGEGSAIVALADPVAAQRDLALEKYPEATAYADHTELLDQKLDGVFLTTPDDLHEGPAIDFLTAGVSVFVEKPLAITTEGCDRVLRAAYESGARLYVGHNMRHMPVVQTMRQLIQDGAIGDVKAIWCRHFVGHGGDFYFKDWHADRRRTTGPAAAEGCPRHRRDALARQRLHQARQRDGRTYPVRRHRRPARPDRTAVLRLRQLGQLAAAGAEGPRLR